MQCLEQLVEEQAQGLLAVQNGNPEAVEEDDGQGGRSILESLRKRICQGRVRHMEVGFSEILLQGVLILISIGPQVTAATFSSTIDSS